MRFAPIFTLAALLAAGCTKPAVVGGCSSNLDCKDGQTCVDGSCTGAATGIDCGSETRCNDDANCGANGRCEGGCCLPSCTTDQECGDAMICRRSVCVEDGAPCEVNDDCAHNASAPVCDVSTGGCVGCVEDHDCSTGATCEHHGCVTPPPSGCTTDDQCTDVPELRHCLASQGRCVACLNDAQCPQPPQGVATCDLANHACRTTLPGCDRDSDCASSAFGPHCDTTTRSCVACLANADCPQGKTCSREHTCEAATGCTPGTQTGCFHHTWCRSDRTCVECLSSTQCPSGQRCESNHCVAPTNGCWEKSMCFDPTPACDLSTRQCVACRSDADCDYRFCQAGTCVACTDAASCAESSWLTRPYCYEGRCAECLGDTNCDDGLVCVDETCAPDPIDTPCPSSGVCPRDYVCTNPDGAGSYCRAPCNPYDASPCPSGKRCALAGFSGGLPLGACVPVNPGKPQEGASCGDGIECDAGLVCVPSGAGAGTCRQLCDPDRSTGVCSGGTTCQAIVEVDPTGVPRGVGACFPPSHYLQPCSSNGSCDPGMVCAPAPNPDLPTQFRNECTWPVGSKSGGVACLTDGECESGVCLMAMPKNQGAPGFCMGGCASDSICPARPDGAAQGACESYPVPWHDQSGAPSTVTLDTCVVQCTEDLDCPAGTTCEAVPNATGTAFVTRCRAYDGDTAGKGGAPCASNADCRSNDCVTFGPRPVGICEAACGPSGDANCATGSVCPPAGVMRPVTSSTYADAHICWGRPCSSDVDCGSGRVCGADPDPANARDLVLSCRPTEGSLAGGAACSTNGDCKSGFCVTWSSTKHLCFGTCQTGADCASGSRCNEQHWHSDTPNELTICVPQ